MSTQETQDRSASDAREAMYSVADRLQLLSPTSFAATQTLGSLGHNILPSLLSREAGPVRASLHFLLHALAPLTATDAAKKVGAVLLACQGWQKNLRWLPLCGGEFCSR